MYPTFICEKAKRLIGSNPVASSFTAGDLMEFLGDAQEALVAQARNKFPLVGAVTTTVNQVSGTTEQTLPADFDRFLRMKDLTTDWQKYAVPWLSDLASGLAFSDTELRWIHADQNNAWEMLYTFAPIRMHKGVSASATDEHLILDTDGSTTAVGPIHYFDDFYNRAQILVRDCTTAAKEWQVAMVDDYVGKDRKCILDSNGWPGGTPDGTTIMYEIMPMLNAKRWQTILAYEVANRILGIGTGKQTDRDMRSGYWQAYRDFMTHWRNINSGWPAMTLCPSLELHA